MRKIYKVKESRNQMLSLCFFMFVLFCASCSKENPDSGEGVIKIETDIYAYEVTCVSCEIQFMDENKSTKKVSHSNGKWNYSFKKDFDADLKINIKTTNNNFQHINAYILKNSEVIYGDLGYNNFELLYNIKSGQKSMKFGSYAGGSNGSGPNGGTTKPTSSVCGARTKAGGYCKRVVSGGGRCWQHS